MVRIHRREPVRPPGGGEAPEELHGVVEDHRGRQAPFHDAAELWRLLSTRLAGARRAWNGPR